MMNNAGTSVEDFVLIFSGVSDSVRSVVDVYSAEKRSEIMKAVRPSGNASTELRLIHLMRERGVVGWRRKAKVPGNPDFVFRRQRVAVFVDGDFWHGNPKNFVSPKTNPEFWKAKIEGNRARDKRNGRLLKKLGWTVVRIWESDLRKRPERCLNRLCRALEKSGAILLA